MTELAKELMQFEEAFKQWLLVKGITDPARLSPQELMMWRSGYYAEARGVPQPAHTGKPGVTDIEG